MRYPAGLPITIKAMDADLHQMLSDSGQGICAKARIIAHFQHGALLYFDSIKGAAYISTARRGLLPMQVVASSTVLESLSTAELESELTMPLSSNRGLRIFQLADGMKNLWLDQSVLEKSWAAASIRRFLAGHSNGGGLGKWKEFFSPDWRWARALSADVNEDAKLMAGLLGRGEGSTPAGDDMLIGAAAVHFMMSAKSGSSVQAQRSKLWLSKLNSLSAAFELRTTTASCTYLRAACRGRFASHLIGVLRAALSGRDDFLSAACVRLSRHGRTSGSDALAGAALALGGLI